MHRAAGPSVVAVSSVAGGARGKLACLGCNCRGMEGQDRHNGQELGVHVVLLVLDVFLVDLRSESGWSKR